jgi:hypothetical protein
LSRQPGKQNLLHALHGITDLSKRKKAPRKTRISANCPKTAGRHLFGKKDPTLEKH